MYECGHGGFAPMAMNEWKKRDRAFQRKRGAD
jgi:hypothetical protein